MSRNHMQEFGWDGSADPTFTHRDKKIAVLEERAAFPCVWCKLSVFPIQKVGDYRGTPMHFRCASEAEAQDEHLDGTAA